MALFWPKRPGRSSMELLFWALNTPVENLIANGVLCMVAMTITLYSVPRIWEALLESLSDIKKIVLQSLSDTIDELNERYGEVPVRPIRQPERRRRITRDTKIA